MTESTRRTIRTVLQGVLAFAVLAPLIVQQLGLDTDKLPWLAGALAVLAAITKVMNLPQVEQFLQRYLPGIASGVAVDGRHESGRDGDSADGDGGDSGHAMTVLVLLLAAAFVAVATALPAAAHRRPPRPAPAPAERVLVLRQALLCDGVLWAVYDVQAPDGTVLQDDGKVALRLHFAGGREGVDGTFRQVPVHRRGEGRVAYDTRISAVPAWNAVDVVQTDSAGRIHSNSRPAVAGCPA